MKIKNSVEYKVFAQGKSSSRPQHLAFNEHCHRLLWFACPSAAISVFAASIHHGGEWICLWELFLVPPLFKFHELWATPDSDLAYQVHGFRGFYWTLYSRLVSGHRSVFSHSLLLGTPIRFCVGYWWAILGFVIGWNWETVYAVGQGAIAFNTGITLLTFPAFALRFLGFWYGACVLADLAHLILDKLNPIEWLIGER